MTLNVRQDNNNKPSMFGPMVKGAIIGAGAGFVAKYAYPLTYDEKHCTEYIESRNLISQRYTAFSPISKEFVEVIKSKKDLTLAEDTFVKMFDGIQEGETLKRSKIRQALQLITEKDPKELIPFKRLFKILSEPTQEILQKNLKAYNMMFKEMRPAKFFVATGAIFGAFVAMFDDALKTNIKD